MASAKVSQVKIIGNTLLVTVVGNSGIAGRKHVLAYLALPSGFLIQRSFTNDDGGFNVVFVVQNQSNIQPNGFAWVQDLINLIPYAGDLANTISFDDTGATIPCA